MPEAGTVNGYSNYWKCSGNMRTTTRVKLSESCTNPTISIHQYNQGDTSIQGSYYVTSDNGDILAFSPLRLIADVQIVPHPTQLAGITLNANTYYHLGFQNDSSACDMCCPSVYPDNATRSVGIGSSTTLDGPTRKPQPRSPGNSANWQNRWLLKGVGDDLMSSELWQKAHASFVTDSVKGLTPLLRLEAHLSRIDATTPCSTRLCTALTKQP